MVYKTADDYKNNSPIEGKKIGWGMRFTWKGTEEVLRLKTTDNTLKYKAGTAFAYIDTDCKTYRYYNEDAFIEVISKNNFCLYTHSALTPNPKAPVNYTRYYFSKDFFSPIFELTKKNLLTQYADNNSFCESIKKQKNDEDLIKTDKTNNEYFIITLYNQSK